MACDCCEDQEYLTLGDEVPEFDLITFEPTRGDFGEFSLSKAKAAKKWTILFFYPGDFTFVCTTEFAALAELHEQFVRLGAELITVSTDSKYVHLAWHQHEAGLKHAKFVMGADPTGNLSRLFDVYNEETGQAFRGTFLIDPDGKLLAKEVHFGDVGRNIDELLRKFKAYLHVSQNPTEACPSKWKDKGDATLKPSAKMVGNVYAADGNFK